MDKKHVVLPKMKVHNAGSSTGSSGKGVEKKLRRIGDSTTLAAMAAPPEASGVHTHKK